ncbi:MAG: hypothetical protein QG651_376 [Pseudomonadota bacterium]|jgi:uncharacterized membrane protein YoaK (UPF0700 family)|nr:DUF1275 domain-containing protein [Burkholderiales bacterium]MBP9769669.1 DUF1275 domain-containing protein [Burkholderiales bacterium]MDQ5947882.1 hypothetical protein [Pseudomonadota bacterium]
MEKRDLLNYCQLAFINGVNDAISVIMLHKVFVVLMTGNLIYFVTDITTNFGFGDWVRLTLLLNFIISGILVNNFLAKKSILFKICITLIFVVLYCIIGSVCLQLKNLGDDSWGFLIVANIATITSVMMNNIFYRLHTTKFNLVAYTMNLINLAHMIAEKRYHELQLLGITFASFISGLIVASCLVVKWDFYTILIIIPILLNLYQVNKRYN